MNILPKCCQGCFYNRIVSGDQICHYMLDTGEQRPRTEDGKPTAEELGFCDAKLVLSPQEKREAIQKLRNLEMTSVPEEDDFAYFPSRYMRQKCRK